MEHVLDQRRITLGRGPGVDLALDHESLAREHAALEFADGEYRLCCLSEGAQTCLNGRPVEKAQLKPDDRFVLGSISFAYAADRRRGS